MKLDGINTPERLINQVKTSLSALFRTFNSFTLSGIVRTSGISTFRDLPGFTHPEEHTQK